MKRQFLILRIRPFSPFPRRERHRNTRLPQSIKAVIFGFRLTQEIHTEVPDCQPGEVAEWLKALAC